MKKTVTYARFKDSKRYVRDKETGELRKYWISDVLRMKRTNGGWYDQIEFFSLRWKEENRRQMFPIKSGFFRYKPEKGAPIVVGKPDSELYSHATAIGLLQGMKTIKFLFDGELVVFNFKMMDVEVDSTFPNGSSYQSDLYGEFSRGNKFFERWGGRVAIEVCVTHLCEPKRRQDFEDHGVPIIEIQIPDEWRFRQEGSREDVTPDDTDAYRDFLTDKFAEGIPATIISNPVTVRYHGAMVTKLITEKKAAIAELQSERVAKVEMVSLISTRDQQVRDLLNAASQLQDRVKQRDDALTKVQGDVNSYRHMAEGFKSERDFLESRTLKGRVKKIIDSVLGRQSASD